MRKMLPLLFAAALCPALAACGGPGPWTKSGVSDARAATDYANCRREGQHEIRRDVDIDTDIAAGRRGDWSKNQSLQSHLAVDASNNDTRSDDIVRACMLAKGYAPTGPAAESNPRLLNFLGM